MVLFVGSLFNTSQAMQGNVVHLCSSERIEILIFSLAMTVTYRLRWSGIHFIRYQ